MEEQRRRIVEDLAGLLHGEIRCDPLTVSMYSTDGSLYQIAPLGVVFPRSRDDVVTAVRYCAEARIPLIARGAGSGVAGESVGPGVILDFSRHMRDVLAVDQDSVRVQPGVVCRRLNDQLRQHGRYFPPDPSGASVTTIGSMLALDAAGSHSVRVGSTRDHVREIEAVLADGSVITAGTERLDGLDSARTTELAPDGSHEHHEADGAKRELLRQLVPLLKANASLIAERHPPLVRNRCGYYLRGVLDEQHLHLARMLVGSEGTLALFTEATLHTSPLPAHRGVALLLFGEMETALRAVQVIIGLQPSACDLLDRRLLTLAREADPRFAQLIAPGIEAALLVEQTGFTEAQVRGRVQMVVRGVRDLGPPVGSQEAYSEAEIEFLWSLPERVVPLLTRLPGPARPLPFVEDIAVPPDALSEFLGRSQSILQHHRVTASLYAHAAAGQVHLRPFLDPPTPAAGRQLEELAYDLYEAALQVGGTISGEHGTGLARSSFMRWQYGPLFDVFRQIKQIFDPLKILNPDKVLTDDAHLMVRNLRPVALAPPETVKLQLNWSHAELHEVATRCNGCGQCRTQDPDKRMCPLFRIDPHEEASPRAKANLVRDLTTGSLPMEALTTPAFKRLANLCFNCKQCQLECPSNVNIPQMMIEAKAAYVQAHGLTGADWLLSQAHSFGAMGSALYLAANWVIESPVARWMLEKGVGIARRRKLARFARRSFLRMARRDLLTRPPLKRGRRPVVYFVDYYANYHDPELGLALVAVLQHHGIPVYVPPGQVASGMAMVSAGDLDGARELAEQNLRELGELAREGCPIVCTEPAAALCLKQEYPLLINHPDMDALTSQVFEAGIYLKRLHAEGRLRTDFQTLDLDVGYHTPCHLRALTPETPFKDLLSLIPGLRMHTINEGCSGMAGAFGLTKENFRNSLRIGWGLVSRMREGDLTAGITECSSCKLQMEQGTRTPTVHPLKILALAYGLMPELRQRLKRNQARLVVT